MLKNNSSKNDLKIFYYDLETVNLEREDGCVFWQISGIIEINGEIKEEFNFFVNPGDDATYQDGCMEFNNLTIEQVMKYDHHTVIYDKIITMLDQYVSKYDKTDKFMMIGYNNISFDNPRLRDWFNHIDSVKKNKYSAFGSYFWSNSIDVFPLLSLLFIKYRNIFDNFRLETVGPKCAELGIIDSIYKDNANFHDALYDVQITRALFIACSNIFKLNIYN